MRASDFETAINSVLALIKTAKADQVEALGKGIVNICSAAGLMEQAYSEAYKIEQHKLANSPIAQAGKR